MAEQSRGRVRAEKGAKRVRAYLGGELVADTRSPLLVWEVPYYPAYYLPAEDLKAELVATGDSAHSPSRGDAPVFDVKVSRATASAAAQRYDASPIDDLAGHVRLTWDAMSDWFEEDERIVGHPRNPYVRVDALRSHRHLTVELDGVPLADTTSPVLLFETGLPTRYYIDRTDVVFEHLTPTDTETLCPYKGTTSGYWSVRVGDTVHDDLAWTYDYPLPPVSPIAGMIAFYNEKLDITVDGVRLPRPNTHFS